MTTRRILNSIIAISVILSTFLFVLAPAEAAISAEGVNLDQWDPIAADWQNGNLGKDLYSEGRVVPFRAALENFVQNTQYQITISHELTKGGNLGYDFLAKYNQTDPVSLTQLCSTTGGADSSLCLLTGGLSNAGIVNPAMQTQIVYSAVSPTFATPPHMAGVNVLGAVNQNVGAANAVLTSWGAQSVSISAPTLSGSTTGDSTLAIVVTFRTPTTCTGGVCPILFAWGGHLASSSYWRTNLGAANGAGAISGSSYHMRTVGYGNQDKSIKTGTDLLTFLEVVKDLNSTNHPLGTFNLWVQRAAGTPEMKAENVGDNGTTGSIVYTDITAATPFTVSETAYTGTELSWYWKVVRCYDRFGAATPIAQTPEFYNLASLTLNIEPGQDIKCVIENKDIPTAPNVVNGTAVPSIGMVEIKWEALFPDALGYVIYRDEQPVSGLIAPNETNLYQYLDTAVEPGKTYSYWIQPLGGDKFDLGSVTLPDYVNLRLPLVICK